MKIIPYGHQWIDQDDVDAVTGVLKSDWITQGPKVAEFEKKVAGYCKAKYAVALNSGTAALHAACFAAGIKRGDEVVTTPLSFLATANCVVYQQARPVFADIALETFNIDPEQVRRKIGRKTKAIIAVHFAGLPCDLDNISKIALRSNLLLIEDAAHALGAEYRGRKIGSIGDLTIFSFHPVKAITTAEGGMVLTNNKKLYQRILNFRNHGILKSKNITEKNGPWYYQMQYPGFNYRLSDVQCALGISQMHKLSQFIKRRNEISYIYNELFKGISDFIWLPPVGAEYTRHAWHLYVIRIKPGGLKIDRRVFFELLRAKNIGVQVHYIPLHLQPFYRKNFGYKKGDFPNAERFYARAISLPIFPLMSNKDIFKVADSVKKIIFRHKK